MVISLENRDVHNSSNWDFAHLVFACFRLSAKSVLICDQQNSLITHLFIIIIMHVQKCLENL